MLKQGIIASPGIAIAKAFVYAKVEVEVEKKTVDDTAAETARLDAALDASKEQLAAIKAKAERDLGAEEAEIFEAHAMILEDQNLPTASETKLTQAALMRNLLRKQLPISFMLCLMPWTILILEVAQPISVTSARVCSTT